MPKPEVKPPENKPGKKKIPHEIRIGDKVYHARFEYDTYGDVRTKHGENPDYLNPLVLSDYILAGLKDQVPDLTLDAIKKARPPLVPAILDIKDAIQNLYYGDTPPPDSADELE